MNSKSSRSLRTGALASALALAASSLVAAPAQAATPPLTMFTEALPIPPVLDLTAGGSVSLSAVPGSHQFHTSLPATPTWGYVPTGSTPTDVLLGPTLEVRRGLPVSLTVTNALSGQHPLANAIDTTLHGVSALDRTAPRISTHLHGGHTPPDSDGGPEDTFRPAGTTLPNGETDFGGGTGQVVYDYPNDQEASTLWYHDHALGITRLNVMAGLAGFYLVRDQYDTGDPGNLVGLPTGDHEVPLVLQDRMFNADGTLAYPTGPFYSPDPAMCPDPTMPDLPCQWLPEFFGDVATVNGKAWPNHTVEQDVYRIRLLNGSNARVYDLKLASATGATAPILQIGTDGGLLNAPVRVNRLVLAPGERADLLIDFRAVPAGSKLVLTNGATTPYPSGPRAARRGGAPLRDIMQFTVGAATGTTGTVPTVLRGVGDRPAALPALTPARTRVVTLNEIMNMQFGAPMAALLNNTRYHEAVMDANLREQVKLNTVEEWVIVNTTADTHPMHLHLTQFRVKDRQRIDVAAFQAATNGKENLTPFLRGSPRRPAAEETGWKDTAKASPGEVLRILVPFGGTAAGIPSAFSGDAASSPVQRFIGRYVWHCHILEHEDNDMMLPYDVVL